jgi:L-seryl-tRNA(Ser) seleniumtransferase
VQESIAAGADVVCFSGDKLLGGPQCGVIVGRRELIGRMKKNQLMRALRCDKMTLAVLEATLRLFLDGETLLRTHPVLRMLTQPQETIRERCQRLAAALRPALAGLASIEVEPDFSEVGSGSMAGAALPTTIIVIRPSTMPSEEMARRLRTIRIPVIGRIREGAFILDGRTIADEDLELVLNGFGEVYPAEVSNRPGRSTP